MSLNVYPVYEVSPDTTGYVPSMAPGGGGGGGGRDLHRLQSRCLPPVAVDGVLACDLNLLDPGTDLSLLAIPLFPLPAGMLLVPLLPSDQPSTWPRGGSSGPGLFLPQVTCPGRDPLTPTALRWTLGSPFGVQWAAGLPLSYDVLRR